jgi:hypothetical protein
MKDLARKLLVATAAAAVLAVSALAQVAMPQSLPAGNGSDGVAFDGTYIWMTNFWNGFGNGTVTKQLAATGQIAGTYNVGVAPGHLVFDGTNIWVANVGDNTAITPGWGPLLGPHLLRSVTADARSTPPPPLPPPV